MPRTVLALVLGSLEAKVALSSALGGGMQIQGGALRRHTHLGDRSRPLPLLLAKVARDSATVKSPKWVCLLR